MNIEIVETIKLKIRSKNVKLLGMFSCKDRILLIENLKYQRNDIVVPFFK